MGIIIIYATYPNMEEAKKVVHSLIEKRLISCANFFQLRVPTDGKVR